MKHKPWTEKDREKLVRNVSTNIDFEGHVDWVKVSKDFRNRSKQQLKSYYLNIIVKQNQGKNLGLTIEFWKNAVCCCYSVDLLLNIYSTLTKDQIRQALQQMYLRYADLSGCFIYVKLYPNCSHDFKIQDLDDLANVAVVGLEQYDSIISQMQLANVPQEIKKAAFSKIEHFTKTNLMILLTEVNKVRYLKGFARDQ